MQIPGWSKRKPILTFTFALCLASICADAVDLCSFRSPSTDLTHLLLTANYAYLDLPDTVHHDVSSGRLSLSFSHLHDEPDFALSISGTTEFSFDRLRFERAVANAFMTTRFYIEAGRPEFLFAEVSGEDSSAISEPGLEIRFGVGFGRLTDATPLAKALRIQTMLLETLMLTAPMSESTLLEIAGLIAQESAFPGIGELVSRIGDVIEAGAGIGLDARSLFAIANEIGSSGSSLTCGWVNQVGLGYELAPRFGSIRQPLLTLATDMSQPLTLDSQVEAHGDISFPILAREAYSLVGSLHYTRRLTHVARIVAEYSLQRVKQPGVDASVAQSLEFQLLLDFGSATVTASASLSRGSGMPGWIEAFSISTRIDLL